MMSASARSGVTLLEVMVATVIGAAIVLSAHRLIAQVAMAASQAGRSSANQNQRANGLRLLRDLAAQAERRAPTTNDAIGAAAQIAVGLSGTESRIEFPTWCKVAAGWQERCVAILRIQEQLNWPTDQQERSAPWTVHLALSTYGDLVLSESRTPITFRYLLSESEGGIWTNLWAPNVALPQALGMITGSDTTMLRVGRTVQ